jgi:hypothetical protein
MNTRALLGGAAIIAATFTAGALAGVRYERSHAPEPQPATAMMTAHHVLMKLNDELGLDSAQHRKIEAILARHQAAVDSSWVSMQPRVRAALDSTLRDMMAVLRPDQVARYRMFVQRMHPGMLEH